MQVGDIVKHFLTEQIGVILEIRNGKRVPLQSAHVLWTKQGESLFGPGHKEWCFENSLAVMTSS